MICLIVQTPSYELFVLHTMLIRMWTPIEATIRQYAEDRLILIMLGPTAKVLAAHLANDGYQALDIGHIDSEYERLQMGAQTKVKLKHKHTAEYNFDQDIEFIEDEPTPNKSLDRLISFANRIRKIHE